MTIGDPAPSTERAAFTIASGFDITITAESHNIWTDMFITTTVSENVTVNFYDACVDTIVTSTQLEDRVYFIDNDLSSLRE